jgi:hypothetical protein
LCQVLGDDADIEFEVSDNEEMVLKPWGRFVPLNASCELIEFAEPEYTFGRDTACNFTFASNHISSVHGKIKIGVIDANGDPTVEFEDTRCELSCIYLSSLFL